MLHYHEAAPESLCTSTSILLLAAAYEKHWRAERLKIDVDAVALAALLPAQSPPAGSRFSLLPCVGIC